MTQTGLIESILNDLVLYNYILGQMRVVVILRLCVYIGNGLFDAISDSWLKHALTRQLAHLSDRVRVASSVTLRTCICNSINITHVRHLYIRGQYVVPHSLGPEYWLLFMCQICVRYV